MKVRVAAASDLQAVAVTLTEAFSDDPVWSWAFPEPAQLEVWWRFWVAAALPHGWVRTTPGFEAVAMWLPPGARECPPEDEPHIEQLIRALSGTRAELVLETIDRFDSTHPRETPHYYLSLLGTGTDHRGRGIGMELLVENLARLDELVAPAYLESSNPANLGRYERVGFVARGEFALPGRSTRVTTMWRDPC